MGKIGILTFVKVFNFGAELQAFALSSVIRRLNKEVELIDCSIKTVDVSGCKNPNIIKGFNTLKSRAISKLYRIIDGVFSLIYSKRKKMRLNNYNSFYETYCTFSKKQYLSFTELSSINQDYSVVIVGSDQVWNYTFNFSPELFLLTFVNKNIRKISYAASFGKSSLPLSFHRMYKKALDNFDFVSVREKSAVKILNDIGVSSVEVLDPTLLIGKDEWVSLLSLQRKMDKEYILIYELLEFDGINDFARQIASKYNLAIVSIIPRFYTLKRKEKNFIYVYDAGPKEFVELFAFAKFVLTTSFHGTAFAVNFEKPFYTFLNRKRTNNSRMIDFLSDLGLESRIIQEKKNLDGEIMMSFDEVRDKLYVKREESLSFIKKAVL